MWEKFTDLSLSSEQYNYTMYNVYSVTPSVYLWSVFDSELEISQVKIQVGTKLFIRTVHLVLAYLPSLHLNKLHTQIIWSIGINKNVLNSNQKLSSHTDEHEFHVVMHLKSYTVNFQQLSNNISLISSFQMLINF